MTTSRRSALLGVELEPLITQLLAGDDGEEIAMGKLLQNWLTDMRKMHDTAGDLVDAGATVEELRAFVFREVELATQPVRIYKRQRDPFCTEPRAH